MVWAFRELAKCSQIMQDHLRSQDAGLLAPASFLTDLGDWQNQDEALAINIRGAATRNLGGSAQYRFANRLSSSAHTITEL